MAAAEGQKIYTITQANLSIALQQIQLSSEIKADIRNAVSAGMEVTTHQQPVNFFGSQSVGYLLLDPNTGAGAYRIGGGENGGNIYSLFGSALAIVFGLFFIGLGPMGILLGLTLIYFSIMLFVIETLNFVSAGLVDWSILGLVMAFSPFLAVGVSAVALEQAIVALIWFIVWVIANAHS